MEPNKSRQGLAVVTLGALGVVYGDIGTSPLYTMKEVFGPAPAAAVPMDEANLIGAASTIFWALMLIVTLKYVVLILRADNRGEGGVMALTALAAHAVGDRPRRRGLLLLLGLFGATQFYGDSVITPSISVLGAVEGLEIAAPGLSHFVVPIAVVVLIGLFFVQRHGTDTVGKFFGPVLVLWFIALAVSGLWQIAQQPAIVAALDPRQALHFLQSRGWHLFAAMGAIVLAITGAEALYADMGHFGRLPIRLAWMGLVLPSLTLNYMGQAALLMRDPSALENPFFHMFPSVAVLPMVLLATAASVIASQAVISGAYSITKQAIQLGFLPRMQVLYTSAKEQGQIYMPEVNSFLLVAVLLATIGFGSSSALAAAYGIAVTVTMLSTTILTFFVVRYGWGYPLVIAFGATGLFLALDILLVTSTSLKFLQGGWFPIVMGIGLFTVMTTWKRGREILVENMREDNAELLPFISALAEEDMARVPRTAVYAVADPDIVPQALLHNLKHNQVLHEQNIILTVAFHDVPWIPFDERVEIEPLVRGFWRVRVNYGFKNQPDIPKALGLCEGRGLEIEPMTTSYFLSREVVVPMKGGPGMAHWREAMFATMSRNAGSVVEFFRLPNNAVIELGTRVQI
jgi:KUP system potassium uptake protein